LRDGSFGNSTSFAASTSCSTGSAANGAASVTVADLNGDGVEDILTNNWSDNTVGIFFGSTVDGVALLLPFSLKTIPDSRQALPVFKRKLDQLAEQRGTIGSFQSRIGVATNVLQVASENFAAAASRITDADTAEESSRLVRLGILQQAASSVLAQANTQPALALQLLG